MKPNRNSNERENFGWQFRHVVGFVLCIMLTAFALWATFYSDYQPKWVFLSLAILAFIQALVQLFQVDIDN